MIPDCLEGKYYEELIPYISSALAACGFNQHDIDDIITQGQYCLFKLNNKPISARTAYNLLEEHEFATALARAAYHRTAIRCPEKLREDGAWYIDDTKQILFEIV